MLKLDNQDLIKDYEIEYQEVAKQILAQRVTKNSDIATEILKSRSKGIGDNLKVNTQAEFIQALKGYTFNKLQLQMLDAERLENEKQKETEAQKIEKKGITSQNIDKQVDKALDKGKAKKNSLESKIVNKKDLKKQRSEFKSEILKLIYDDSMERYYHLKLDVQKHLAQKGKLVASDRVYTEYLEYQNYLRKIDMAYKIQNGRYIALDDQNIQKKEKQKLEKTMQGEYKTQEDVANSIASYKKVQDDIENLNEDIVKCAKDYSAGRIGRDDYDQKLDSLQQKIVQKNQDLEKIKPTNKELEQYMVNSEQQENAQDRVLGTSYQNYMSKKQIDSRSNKTKSLDKSQNVYYKEKIESLESEKEAVDTQIKSEEKISQKQVGAGSSFEKTLKDNVKPKDEIEQSDLQSLEKLKQRSALIDKDLAKAKQEQDQQVR